MALRPIFIALVLGAITAGGSVFSKDVAACTTPASVFAARSDVLVERPPDGNCCSEKTCCR